MRLPTAAAVPAVLVLLLTAGCVPGQPYRAADTAKAYLQAYVGATNEDPQKYGCPAVDLPKLEPPAPSAEISVSEAKNNPNGTMTVDGTYTVNGKANTVAITLRTDGKCILNIKK